MMLYNTIQQVQFFSSCKNATSLLETRNQLEYMQNISSVALVCYNLQMTLLLLENKIQ